MTAPERRLLLALASALGGQARQGCSDRACGCPGRGIEGEAAFAIRCNPCPLNDTAEMHDALIALLVPSGREAEA